MTNNLKVVVNNTVPKEQEETNKNYDRTENKQIIGLLRKINLNYDKPEHKHIKPRIIFEDDKNDQYYGKINIEKIQKDIFSIKDDVNFLIEDMKATKELLTQIYISSSIKGDDDMYEMKEVIEKLNGLEKTIAVIEERTKKLESIENNYATKDYVQSEIKSAKIWIIITAVGTGLTFLGTIATLIKLFTA